VKATEVTAGLAESNGRLLPGLWRDSLHVICVLTACTPGSAPGPTLGNEYGKTLPLLFFVGQVEKVMVDALGALSGDLAGKYYPLKGMNKEEEAQLIAVSSTH